MISEDLTDKPWAVTPEKIAEAVRRLVAAAAPTRLIAFGSAATGDLSMANDLDLLVVEAQVADRYQEMLRLRRVLRGLLMPIDLIVTSQPSTTPAPRCRAPWSSLPARNAGCSMRAIELMPEDRLPEPAPGNTLQHKLLSSAQP
jgi:predicted nucleotidyltransferase